MVKLAISDADDTTWKEFLARAEKSDILPEEYLECVEGRARAELRSGNRELGEKIYKEALDLAEKNPEHVVSKRVMRAYTEYVAA
jgi:DNA-binding ferritin-like protein (Dps family)